MIVGSKSVDAGSNIAESFPFGEQDKVDRRTSDQQCCASAHIRST